MAAAESFLLEHPEWEFRFDLAERLGIPVTELPRRLAQAEWEGWIALWRIRARRDEEARRSAERR